ncbi:unnamed protein product, partial [Meganyctiphanes norvegica]
METVLPFGLSTAPWAFTRVDLFATRDNRPSRDSQLVPSPPGAITPQGELWHPQPSFFQLSAWRLIGRWVFIDVPLNTHLEDGVIDTMSYVQCGHGPSSKGGGVVLPTSRLRRSSFGLAEPAPAFLYYIYFTCWSPVTWGQNFYFYQLRLTNGGGRGVSVDSHMGGWALFEITLQGHQQDFKLISYVQAVFIIKFLLELDNGRVGDQFMNQIQPIAAYVPYMTCPGNHEWAYNFSNYRARFSMPDYESTESLFYSWNMGPIHFISVNTEAYYFLMFGLKVLSNQWNWLINDLEMATKPVARAERPWIIIYGHRPMYCTSSDRDDCTKTDTLTRVGSPVFHFYAMEPLLAKYGVDLAVWAHEHTYERLWPVYNYTVMNGSIDAPYTNPKAPVHIITGSAGCKERHDHFLPKPFWSAFRSRDYGYTRLTAFNKTHLNWQQVSDDQEGEIVDNVWLVRDRHIAYSIHSDEIL